MTLTNLDLQQLDPATGAVQAQSNSAIDNVEQVRSPGAAADAIYKVKATSTVDGLAGRAVRARRPLGRSRRSPLRSPAVTVDVDAATQRASDTATVTATVRNPSADLTAENASVTLQLPAGVELLSGAQTRNLGTLADELVDADLHLDGQRHHRRPQVDHRKRAGQPLRRDVHQHRHRLVHGRRARRRPRPSPRPRARPRERTRRRLGRHRRALGGRPLRRRSLDRRRHLGRLARIDLHRPTRPTRPRRTTATASASARPTHSATPRGMGGVDGGDGRGPAARRRPIRPGGAATDPPAKADPKVTLARVKRTRTGLAHRRPDSDRRRDRPVAVTYSDEDRPQDLPSKPH